MQASTSTSLEDDGLMGHRYQPLAIEKNCFNCHHISKSLLVLGSNPEGMGSSSQRATSISGIWVSSGQREIINSYRGIRK